MRTLIVGDVHGCAAELARLLRVADASRVVLVGDVFTKGPDPVGVWRCVRGHGLASVLGNHDQRLIDVLQGRRTGDAEAERCIAALDADDPSWREWLAALPLWRDVAGWRVVHAALPPSGDPTEARPTQLFSARRWPGSRAHDPWWVEAYEGQVPVVYGHDAVRGLVWRTRDGRPWVVGLDSGCVYGGQLSGLVIETQELIQVPATRVYRPVGPAAREAQ